MNKTANPGCPLSLSAELGGLLAASAEEQQQAGYADTLREILQQPQTWRDTAELLGGPVAAAVLSQVLVSRPEHIVLTGSGSSVHVGECLAGVLQAALRIPCRAIPAGDLLTNLHGMLAPGRGRTRIGRFWVYAFDPRPWGGTGPPAAM